MRCLRAFSILLILTLCFAYQQQAEAQDKMKASVFGNGGGIMEGSGYRIAGTLGQPLIGESGDVSSTVHAGFWYIAGPPPPIPTIVVISPNGGETWCGDSTQTINWAITGQGIVQIHLQYSVNGGAYQDIITVPVSQSSHEWTVPEIDSSAVRVKAIAEDAGGALLAEDTSNGDFTIQLPQIGVAPANLAFSAQPGGSNPVAKTLNITNPACGTLNWTVSDDAAGPDWLTCAPTTGSCTSETDVVTVSVDITGLGLGTYNATITITATTASNTPQTVPVSLNITESANSVTVFDPNGGDTWCGGSTQTITWEATGPDIDHIHLQYSTNSGGSYQDIIENTPNNGTYEWTLPGIESSTARVKAIAVASGGAHLAEDESDSDFTIQLPQISVTPTSLVFYAQPGGGDPDPKILSITNPNCGTLNWSIAVSAGASSISSVSWLSCAPTSGNTTDETDVVTVSIDTSGLGVGIYDANISISAALASNSPQVIPVTLIISTSITTDREMGPGWHLISFPVEPLNPDPAVVLASIANKYDSIWAYDPILSWSIYDPEGASDLTELHSGEGYWLKVEEQCTLSVQGTPITQTAVPLMGGKWNLVGYNSMEEKDAAICMSGVASFIDSVWEYHPLTGWRIYTPDGASDLDVMKPFYGYWIKADVTCTWDLNAPSMP